jgi:hypothetical protein
LPFSNDVGQLLVRSLGDFGAREAAGFHGLPGRCLAFTIGAVTSSALLLI